MNLAAQENLSITPLKLENQHALSLRRSCNDPSNHSNRSPQSSHTSAQHCWNVNADKEASPSSSCPSSSSSQYFSAAEDMLPSPPGHVSPRGQRIERRVRSSSVSISPCKGQRSGRRARSLSPNGQTLNGEKMQNSSRVDVFQKHKETLEYLKN